MKSIKIKAVILSLLVAATAYAVAQGVGSVSINNDFRSTWLQAGMYLGTPAKAPLSDITNKMTYHLCGTKVYDFPSLGGAGQLTNATICAESSALTITGCAFNDQITLGLDQAPVNAFGQITAHISAASTAKVVACANGISDGGSFDMPDASYTVCCNGIGR